MATYLQNISPEAEKVFNENAAHHNAVNLVIDDCRGFCEDSFWQRIVVSFDDFSTQEFMYYF